MRTPKKKTLTAAMTCSRLTEVASDELLSVHRSRHFVAAHPDRSRRYDAYVVRAQHMDATTIMSSKTRCLFSLSRSINLAFYVSGFATAGVLTGRHRSILYFARPIFMKHA